MMALPTDSELVDFAAATYLPDAVPSFSSIEGALRIFVTMRGDGLTIIAIEGTHNLPGWAIDFCALSMRDHPGINHPSLGWLHSGFYASSLLLLPSIAAIVARGPFAICGHSLGAALAVLIAAELTVNGTSPVKVAAFAPPRAGGDKLVEVIKSIPNSGYDFGNDPVPHIPFRILPLWPYQQVPCVRIGKPMVDEFACHHIENYVTGVHALDTKS